jgi:hypothetical protein
MFSKTTNKISLPVVLVVAVRATQKPIDTTIFALFCFVLFLFCFENLLIFCAGSQHHRARHSAGLHADIVAELSKETSSG